MIIFKVWKASSMCVAMSVVVFAIMMTAFVLDGTLRPATEEAAAPVMAAVSLEDASAQETAMPPHTPPGGNLFYLPAPETTPGAPIRFEILRDATTPAPKKRVLIYHTHTWEAYEPTASEPYEPTERWRTKDARYNVVRVGAELAQCLTALGYEVVHEQTAFEPPVLSTAYARSLKMLETYAARGETFDYYIDLHRDAYSAGVYDTNQLTGEGGVEIARLMLLIGDGTGETGGQGFSVKPDWEKNLALAQALTDAINEEIDGLCGKVKRKTGRFNQHVSTGALLVEVGNNKNTLTQALNAMPYLARALKAIDSGL